jgi:hypothetical protein
MTDLVHDLAGREDRPGGHLPLALIAGGGAAVCGGGATNGAHTWTIWGR